MSKSFIEIDKTVVEKAAKNAIKSITKERERLKRELIDYLARPRHWPFKTLTCDQAKHRYDKGWSHCDYSDEACDWRFSRSYGWPIKESAEELLALIASSTCPTMYLSSEHAIFINEYKDQGKQ